MTDHPDELKFSFDSASMDVLTSALKFKPLLVYAHVPVCQEKMRSLVFVHQ